MQVRRTAAIWAVLACLAGLGGCYRSDPAAVRLLRWAQVADRTVPLEGQVAVQMQRRGRPVEATAEVRRWNGRSEMRFTTGPAAGNRVAREGRRLWRPDRGGPPRDLPRRDYDALPPVEVLLRFYRIQLGPPTSVADRATDQVVLTPRAGRRLPTVRLWVDRETGVILARERRDPEGQVVSSSRYLQIRYGRPSGEPPPPPAASDPAPGLAPPPPVPGPSGPSPPGSPGGHRPRR